MKYPNQKEEEGDYVGKDKEELGEINANAEDDNIYYNVGDF